VRELISSRNQGEKMIRSKPFMQGAESKE
jgi:hypothetical protein